MSLNKYRIFNLIVILGLLLVLLPQRSIAASQASDTDDIENSERFYIEQSEIVLNSNDLLPAMAGPKEDLDGTKGANTLYIPGMAFMETFGPKVGRIGSYWNLNPGCLRIHANQSDFTPVELPLLFPDGTYIKYIDLHWIDPNPDSNIYASFKRVLWKGTQDSVEFLALWEPERNSPAPTYLRRSVHHEIEPGYNYMFRVEFPPNQNDIFLCGFAVYYDTPPIFPLGFPTIQK